MAEQLAPPPQAAKSWLRAVAAVELEDRVMLRLKTILGRADALAATLGLPGSGRSRDMGAFEALWIGPGDWLLIGRDGSDAWLGEMRAAALDNEAATALAGDAMVVLDPHLSAEAAGRLIGLPTAAFGAGCAAHTRIADLIVIVTTAPEGGVRFVVERHLAPHLEAWLGQAT